MGSAFIGLNAKTYFCQGETNKMSSKGVSHSCKLTFEDYRKILMKENVECQTNRGIRVKNGDVYTYKVRKTGLTHLYVKRKILSDGISTTYLDI